MHFNKLLFIALGSIFLSCSKKEPVVEDVSLDFNTSLRSVSISRTGTWVSGSKGAVYYKGNAHVSWTNKSPLGYDSLDFRSMAVVNDSIVLLASTTNPAIILRSNNAGDSWEQVYQDTSAGAFFDALKVDSTGLGFVLGDPLDGVFALYMTKDFGRSWIKLDKEKSPKAGEKEYAFAASNSSLLQIRNGVLFVTGGESGAYIHAGVPEDGSWKKELLGMYGSSACGAFNICRKGDDLMIGGGCYDKIERSEENMLFSDNMGTQWFSLPAGPKGYVSSMAFAAKKHLVAVGDIGLQWAPARTRNFTLIPDTEKLNVVACNDVYCIAAGKEGKVLKITFQ